MPPRGPALQGTEQRQERCGEGWKLPTCPATTDEWISQMGNLHTINMTQPEKGQAFCHTLPRSMCRTSCCVSKPVIKAKHRMVHLHEGPRKQNRSFGGLGAGEMDSHWLMGRVLVLR
ncbi:Hypothetical predicted protein [Marmota monax]|uniref:Uncharacterized protein n=1 Tax=Marmota monax TaxID=9995 RepID=A0A5E4CGQ1_MARMO|nr:Hypothetical predicted protein [Marmota monax]